MGAALAAQVTPLISRKKTPSKPTRKAFEDGMYHIQCVRLATVPYIHTLSMNECMVIFNPLRLSFFSLVEVSIHSSQHHGSSTPLFFLGGILSSLLRTRPSVYQVLSSLASKNSHYRSMCGGWSFSLLHL